MRTPKWVTVIRQDPLGAMGTLVAVVAITIGITQFKETQDRQEQSSAVDLYVKYNEMMRDTTVGLTAEQIQWRDNLGIAIAESIFLLREEDSGWVRTVRWMLTNHRAILDGPELDCGTYDAQFRVLINETINRKACADD